MYTRSLPACIASSPLRAAARRCFADLCERRAVKFESPSSEGFKVKGIGFKVQGSGFIGCRI